MDVTPVPSLHLRQKYLQMPPPTHLPTAGSGHKNKARRIPFQLREWRRIKKIAPRPSISCASPQPALPPRTHSEAELDTLFTVSGSSAPTPHFIVILGAVALHVLTGLIKHSSVWECGSLGSAELSEKCELGEDDISPTHPLFSISQNYHSSSITFIPIASDKALDKHLLAMIPASSLPHPLGILLRLRPLLSAIEIDLCKSSVDGGGEEEVFFAPHFLVR